MLEQKMPTQHLDNENGQPAMVDCRSQDAKFQLFDWTEKDRASGSSYKSFKSIEQNGKTYRVYSLKNAIERIEAIIQQIIPKSLTTDTN